MTYKTILVHVDGGKRCQVRVGIAARLAKQFDSHLVGLHAMTMLGIPSYALAEAGNSIIEYQKKAAADIAAKAEANFRKALESADFDKSEWRTSSVDAVEAVSLHARYADLVILGQPGETEGTGVEPDFAERVVLAAGRPVLLIPFAGEFKSVGNRVLVAWNAGREATRAITDSIPLLKRAEQVNIIAFNPDRIDHGAVPGADIGLYLARHGVQVQVSHQFAKDIDVGNLLLSRAADLSADLIVMGGYGHSRLKELVLGGATRTILESMTVPVLMSH